MDESGLTAEILEVMTRRKQLGSKKLIPVYGQLEALTEEALEEMLCEEWDMALFLRPFIFKYISSEEIPLWDFERAVFDDPFSSPRHTARTTRVGPSGRFRTNSRDGAQNLRKLEETRE